MDETDCLIDVVDVCCVCLGCVLVPVEPVCFQCQDQSDGRISCFSMKRICLVCIEKYLELHKHRNERPLKKKCLFCPKTALLQQTPKNKLFRVDYLYMGKDDKTIRKCPMGGCTYQNTHIQIAKHICTECPYYHVECECGHTCVRAQIQDHYKVCELFIFCQLCGMYVVKTEMAQHMYYQHDQTKCFTCHQFVRMDELSNHILSKCPERLTTCEICNTFIRNKLIKNHLKRHVVEVHKNVQMLKNKLHEEEEIFQRILFLIQNLKPD